MKSSEHEEIGKVIDGSVVEGVDAILVSVWTFVTEGAGVRRTSESENEVGAGSESVWL